MFFAALYCRQLADFRVSDLKPLINLQAEGEVLIGGTLMLSIRLGVDRTQTPEAESWLLS